MLFGGVCIHPLHSHLIICLEELFNIFWHAASGIGSASIQPEMNLGGTHCPCEITALFTPPSKTAGEGWMKGERESDVMRCWLPVTIVPSSPCNAGGNKVETSSRHINLLFGFY